MIYYFNLQFKLICRYLRERGVSPMIVIPLLIILFVVFLYFLFRKTEHAALIVIGTSIYFLASLTDKKRIEFIERVFIKKDFYIIRTLENFIVTLPSILFLIYYSKWLESSAVLLLVILFTFLSFDISSKKIIPTPFSKKPFEFPIGFRKSLPLSFLVLFITIMGFASQNSGLVLFALALIFIQYMTFYSKPENEYYVWISNQSSKSFIIDKIKIASKFALLSALPFLIIIAILDLSQLPIAIGIILIGFMNLINIILSKYVSFPENNPILVEFLTAFSILFPPLLLLTIPMYYKKAVKHIKKYLVT